MKNLFLILIVTVLFGACNNANTTRQTNQKSSTEVRAISVDSFLVVAADFVGKELTVKGTVDHVCKHGGKRVKIFSSCPSKSIHGEAGSTMGNFKAEIEGSQVCLTGVVSESKMDLAYVEEYEAKIKQAVADEKEEADMEHKEGVDHHAKLDQVAKWKEEIAASEKGYVSTYYLEVGGYRLCATGTESPCCDKAKAKESCCQGKKVVNDSSKAKSCTDLKEESKPCPKGHQ